MLHRSTFVAFAGSPMDLIICRILFPLWVWEGAPPPPHGYQRPIVQQIKPLTILSLWPPSNVSGHPKRILLTMDVETLQFKVPRLSPCEGDPGLPYKQEAASFWCPASKAGCKMTEHDYLSTGTPSTRYVQFMPSPSKWAPESECRSLGKAQHSILHDTNTDLQGFDRNSNIA